MQMPPRVASDVHPHCGGIGVDGNGDPSGSSVHDWEVSLEESAMQGGLQGEAHLLALKARCPL